MYLPYQYEDLPVSEFSVYLLYESFSCSIFLYSVCVPVYILHIASLMHLTFVPCVIFHIIIFEHLLLCCCVLGISVCGPCCFSSIGMYSLLTFFMLTSFDFCFTVIWACSCHDKYVFIMLEELLLELL